MQRLKKLLTPSTSNRSVEARAIYYAGGAFGVSLIIGLLVFAGSVPVFGRGSIGTLTLLLATIAAFIGYYYQVHLLRSAPTKPTLWQRTHSILTNTALSFIHASLVFLLVTITFYLVQDAFKGLELDKYASSVLVGACTGLIAYATYLIGARVSTLLISTELAAFLVLGVMISMITADDPYWWLLHLSSLGAGSGVSGFTFNVTLIVGGLVIVSIADFVANDFAKLKAKSDHYHEAKITTIRTILVIIGIGLAGVGIFQYDVYPAIHTASASGMAVLFIALILGLPKFVPNFSKAFFSLSYILMGTLVACFILYGRIGYLNLTAFEICCFALIFSWLVIFVRQIAAALSDQQGVKPSKVAR